MTALDASVRFPPTLAADSKYTILAGRLKTTSERAAKRLYKPFCTTLALLRFVGGVFDRVTVQPSSADDVNQPFSVCRVVVVPNI